MLNRNLEEYEYIKNILKNTELFKNLCDDALCDILKEYEYGVWNKADIIDPYLNIKNVFIILNGRLKLLQVDIKSGRSIAIFILSRGDIYDFFTLLDGKEHDVEPIALDKVEYISLPINKVREWIRKYPKFNKSFLPYLGKKMRELEELSESLVFHDTATRLARLILKHTEKNKDEQNHYPVKLINNLSHEALAELIGSVRTVVSLQMKKLKKEGIILSKKGHLVVTDLEKLVQKCGNILP